MAPSCQNTLIFKVINMNTLAKIVLLSAVTLSGQAMAGSVTSNTNDPFASLEPTASS